jgi:hypothetical protein
MLDHVRRAATQASKVPLARNRSRSNIIIVGEDADGGGDFAGLDWPSSSSGLVGMCNLGKGTTGYSSSAGVVPPGGTTARRGSSSSSSSTAAGTGGVVRGRAAGATDPAASRRSAGRLGMIDPLPGRYLPLWFECFVLGARCRNQDKKMMTEARGML